MILYILTVLRCVVKDIAWSAGTDDGLTPWFKRGAIRIIESEGARHPEGRGQSAPVFREHVPEGSWPQALRFSTWAPVWLFGNLYGWQVSKLPQNLLQFHLDPP
jgi:hypothetical protein